MPERSAGFLQETRQALNYIAARKELKYTDHQPKQLQKGVLSGLLTIMPDEVKASGILHNPQRMQLIDAIGSYQIGLNDRIDFSGAGRDDLADLLAEAQKRERAAQERLDTALHALPDAERKRVTEVLNQATKEVEVVEKWIREKRDAGNVSFVDIDAYRNIVNAISNVVITSTIFGDNGLSAKTVPLSPEDMIVPSIQDKYTWVNGNAPHSNTQRAVMIMHNIGMALQIVDDWRGQHIDTLLHIPTYATAALQLTGGDRKAAWAFLQKKKEAYITKAHELGLGKLPANGVVSAFGLMQRTNSFLTKRARENDWLRQRMEKKHPHLRERSFMQGRLDPTT